MLTPNHKGLLALLLVSCIWAFSFGLIKTYLAGIPATFLTLLRLGLAVLIFLPLLRLRSVPKGYRLKFMTLGAIQYGLMYLLLFQAFNYLKAYEVVLFTLLTPLYIELAADLQSKRWSSLRLVSVILAILGAAVIKAEEIDSSQWWMGFLIMQGANLCFGLGQLAYRNLRKRAAITRDHQIYALPFLGAFIFASSIQALLTLPDFSLDVSISGQQFFVILYLGAIASGLGFFLWNWGAARVHSTSLLAVMNNASIPLGVIVSITVFGESADIPRLVLGSAIMLLSLFLATRK